MWLQPQDSFVLRLSEIFGRSSLIFQLLKLLNRTSELHLMLSLSTYMTVTNIFLWWRHSIVLSEVWYRDSSILINFGISGFGNPALVSGGMWILRKSFSRALLLLNECMGLIENRSDNSRQPLGPLNPLIFQNLIFILSGKFRTDIAIFFFHFHCPEGS